VAAAEVASRLSGRPSVQYSEKAFFRRSRVEAVGGEASPVEEPALVAAVREAEAERAAAIVRAEAATTQAEAERAAAIVRAEAATTQAEAERAAAALERATASRAARVAAMFAAGAEVRATLSGFPPGSRAKA
jgi:hypothetical protein